MTKVVPLALSSGLGRTALVLDDNDVVDLLRIAIERSQFAFARHWLRRQVSALPVSVLRKYHQSAEIAFSYRKAALRSYVWRA
jgi:hypothetical protein